MSIVNGPFRLKVLVAKFKGGPLDGVEVRTDSSDHLHVCLARTVLKIVKEWDEVDRGLNWCAWQSFADGVAGGVPNQAYFAREMSWTSIDSKPAAKPGDSQDAIVSCTLEYGPTDRQERVRLAMDNFKLPEWFDKPFADGDEIE
ncbi:MAG TPA: hypothetical protein VHR66_33045 [Gemmataceae bacterium]|nr:hypothetical protein [Gemmataceae bacterium]